MPSYKTCFNNKFMNYIMTCIISKTYFSLLMYSTSGPKIYFFQLFTKFNILGVCLTIWLQSLKELYIYLSLFFREKTSTSESFYKKTHIPSGKRFISIRPWFTKILNAKKHFITKMISMDSCTLIIRCNSFQC